MKKTLKILGLTLAVLIGLLVVAAVTLSLVFDPNQYKGQVVQLVKDKTGRDLRIGKKIGWSFFPRLGIEAGGLELGNAPGFGKEPFARIDAAGVHVAFLPLLRGRIEVSNVYVHGLDLNLAKNTAGRTNWEDLAAAGKAGPAARPEPQKKEAGKLPLETLTVGGLDVKRANLTWRDAQAGSTLAVHNLDLATGRFEAGQPFDLRLGLELSRAKATPIRLALKSRVTASADALKLANVDLKVDDSHLTGSIEVRDFANPALRFDLALDRIDLDRYLGGEAAAQPAAGSASGKPAASEKPVEIPLSTLRSLNVNGKFRAGELKAFGLRSSDTKIQINARNGLVTLGPNSAKLYGGGYRGETVVDARGKALQVRLDEKLEQVQVGPLLKDMRLFDRYSGTGNIAVKLAGQGLDAEQLKRSLSGSAAIDFRNGKIEGVDLVKLIEQARALYDAAHGKPVTVKAKQSDETVFRALTANVVVTNGIARNEDLVLDGDSLRATGRGSADLARETLDYRLKVTVAGEARSKGQTVPVIVGGTFANPSYSVDFGELLKQEAQKQIEKQLQKGLEQLLAPKKRR